MTLAAHAPSSASAPGQPWVLAVAGVGLIGGSLAAALRRAGVVREVLGIGRRPEVLAEAQALGLIDRAVSLQEAAAQADVILLATPVGAMASLLGQLAPVLPAHVVLTDGGSTKQDVVAAARAALGPRLSQFVPGHPIAGSEQSGPQAARADLYVGRDVILTPLPETDPVALARVESLWQAAGAVVSQMTPAQHDSVFASVSHLPHLLAYAYMLDVAGHPQAEQRLRYAGSGFRDFTRIAAGSPEMWRDILLANRDAVLAELAGTQARLTAFAAHLQAGDEAALLTLCEAASDARQAWGREAR